MAGALVAQRLIGEPPGRPDDRRGIITWRHVIMRTRTNSHGVLAVLVLLTLSGCDTFAPETLGSFTWSELEGGPVEEMSTFTAIGRDVLVLGELNTPTACYSLSPDLTETSARLTLRIEARNRDSPNCAQRVGSFRYDAQLNGLDNGTYDLIVVHDIGGNRTEFEHQLVISR
jgi:hypothetical protein